jgi:hypothetical protein
MSNVSQPPTFKGSTIDRYIQFFQVGPSPYPHLQTCWITNNPHSILYVDYIVVVILESGAFLTPCPAIIL